MGDGIVKVNAAVFDIHLRGEIDATFLAGFRSKYDKGNIKPQESEVGGESRVEKMGAHQEEGDLYV